MTQEEERYIKEDGTFDLDKALLANDHDAIIRRLDGMGDRLDIILKQTWSLILPSLPPERRLKVLRELGEGYEDELLALEQEMSNT